MDRLNITLKIMGKAYTFEIDRDKEEAYRLAERNVNNLVGTFRKNDFTGWSDRDYLSMAALHLSIENVNMTLSRTADDGDLQRILDMSTQIDEFLNDPKR